MDMNAETKRFRCPRCGYLFDTDTLPGQCPVLGCDFPLSGIGPTRERTAVRLCGDEVYKVSRAGRGDVILVDPGQRVCVESLSGMKRVWLDGGAHALGWGEAESVVPWDEAEAAIKRIDVSVCEFEARTEEFALMPYARARITYRRAYRLADPDGFLRDPKDIRLADVKDGMRLGFERVFPEILRRGDALTAYAELLRARDGVTPESAMEACRLSEAPGFETVSFRVIGAEIDDEICPQCGKALVRGQCPDYHVVRRCPTCQSAVPGENAAACRFGHPLLYCRYCAKYREYRPEGCPVHGARAFR